jgi:hypothetical protein
LRRLRRGQNDLLEPMKTVWHSSLLALLACTLARGSEELSSEILHNFSIRTRGSTQVFSKSVNGTEFARNPKFWLRGLNGLTAIHAGYGPGATAITRWHVLGAGHWKHDAGSKLYFCDLQDHTVTRTVVAGTDIRSDLKSDTWLAVLDQPLPPSITPMALMPAQWTDQIHAPGLQVAAMNQALAMGWGELISPRKPVDGWFRHGCVYRAPGIAAPLGFEPLHKGDSGYPIVTIVETNLVLLGHLSLESGAAIFLGPDYSCYADDIQAAIRTLGTNHLATEEKLTFVDLSRFR